MCTRIITYEMVSPTRFNVMKCNWIVLKAEAGYCVAKAYTDYFGQYDYYSNYYDKDGEPPTFLARSQTFTVEIGQSVIIPCDVENTGSNKLIIKKLPARGGSEKLLAVGGAKVTTDRRILVDGSRLTITHALPRDAGTFLCHFDLEPPLQLRHTLDVQSAPSVKSLSPPEQVIKKGEEVVLQCKAHGNPTPIIRWSRQEGFMPSGKTTEQGQNVTLKDVDRHVDGTYLCTADNGIGEPASARMVVTVEYPPEISTEKDVVRSTEGETVELLCLVHGRPVPTVGWTHDGAALPDTHMDSEVDTPQDYAHDVYDAHTTQSHVSHRHTLTIQNITDVDFGSYMCIAENTHGVTNATIQLTGLPMSPMFTSSPNGEESHRYTLTWGTESLSPITEFVIKVRKSLTSPWQNTTVVTTPATWKVVTRTVDPSLAQEKNHLHYTMDFTLAELEVATDYTVVAKVKNKYGWSPLSEPFVFSTKKGNEAMAVLQSTNDATLHSSTASFCRLSVIASVFALWRSRCTWI
ncbi:protein amalgam-like [Penaeus monodon]|uniref:protein amalgam-like n=1 Tax=Penaeus monodon TaxID=6687 RepID=UPI0018A7349C|nr:protein amalgam-like [Penaeus monodon]